MKSREQKGRCSGRGQNAGQKRDKRCKQDEDQSFVEQENREEGEKEREETERPGEMGT
jgi:hypothetical protein